MTTTEAETPTGEFLDERNEDPLQRAFALGSAVAWQCNKVASTGCIGSTESGRIRHATIELVDLMNDHGSAVCVRFGEGFDSTRDRSLNSDWRNDPSSPASPCDLLPNRGGDILGD